MIREQYTKLKFYLNSLVARLIPATATIIPTIKINFS